MSKHEAGKSILRFTQRVSESVNKCDKTNYLEYTNELIEYIDQMNPWLRRIITAAEEYADMNLASKVVDAFHKNKEKTNTTERFGAALGDVAVHSEKVAPNFAAILREAANVHSRMAEARKVLDKEINRTFVKDLKLFQTEVLADALEAKTTLEHCRLDLDSSKSKVRHAKTAELKSKHEAEVERGEIEFNKIQAKSVEIFEKTCQEFDNLKVKMLDLIRAEKNYHNTCIQECLNMLGE